MDLWNGDVVIWDKSSKLYNPITLEMKHLVDLLELLKRNTFKWGLYVYSWLITLCLMFKLRWHLCNGLYRSQCCLSICLSTHTSVCLSLPQYHSGHNSAVINMNHSPTDWERWVNVIFERRHIHICHWIWNLMSNFFVQLEVFPKQKLCPIYMFGSLEVVK